MTRIMLSCRLYIGAVLLIALLQSCGENHVSDWPFEQVDADHTGITFENHIEYSDEYNIFRYRNFYNGGGVAIADINNDGLADVYLTSNTGSNGLYLNKGDFRFENITTSAGVGSVDKWSTGVSVVDLNNDGWLDICVCNAGARRHGDKRNELYINSGDVTFTEMAAAYIPVHSKKDLTQQIETLKKKNLRHSEVATKSIQDLFDQQALVKAMVLEAKWLRSSVAVNDGTGKFTLKASPSEIQLSSINAIVSKDLNVMAAGSHFGRK